METNKGNGDRARRFGKGSADARGIVITDGGVGSRLTRQIPRVRAFIYGESVPTTPTLPFGRWKAAS
ncbi:MAG: hypothetical protein WD960_06685 [Gemmatimonadota bacterium]